MPEEKLQAFLSKVAQDPRLQKLIHNEDADILAIAAEIGFQFTAEDLQSSLELGDHELSAEELERVAGGNLIAMLNKAAAKLNSVRKKSQECVASPLSTSSNQSDSKSSWCQSGKDMCTY